MYAEVAWVLVSLGTQVQPQVILDPNYLPDYLSVSYDYVWNRTIETSSQSLANLNNNIEPNHCEGHLTTFYENQQQNKRTDNDFTCYCPKKCKGLIELTAHQRSSVASSLDDLKALFPQSDTKNQPESNDGGEESTLLQLENISVKEGRKLLTT